MELTTSKLQFDEAYSCWLLWSWHFQHFIYFLLLHMKRKALLSYSFFIIVYFSIYFHFISTLKQLMLQSGSKTKVHKRLALTQDLNKIMQKIARPLINEKNKQCSMFKTYGELAFLLTTPKVRHSNLDAAITDGKLRHFLGGAVIFISLQTYIAPPIGKNVRFALPTLGGRQK